jgi:hypothetical protein
MKRAFCIATMLFLFGGAYNQLAQAEDFGQASVVTSLFADAKGCPGKVCKDQADAERLNALCKKAERQCSTAWALDEPAKGPRCVTAVNTLCPFTAGGNTTPAIADNTPAIADNTTKRARTKVANPCVPSPCGEGNVCKVENKAAACYCNGRSMRYGEKCENTFTPPVACPTCPAAPTCEGKCLPLPESINCHLAFWMVVFIAILITLVILIFGTPRIRGKRFPGLIGYRKMWIEAKRR